MWVAGKGQQIVEFLYMFDGAAGTQAYEDRTLAQGTVQKSGDTVTAFAVTSIPGAHGLAVTGKDGLAAQVMFAKGRFLTQIIVLGPGATAPIATSLAAQAFGRIQ